MSRYVMTLKDYNRIYQGDHPVRAALFHPALPR